MWKLEKNVKNYTEVQKYTCDICEKTLCMKWHFKNTGRYMKILEQRSVTT